MIRKKWMLLIAIAFLLGAAAWLGPELWQYGITGRYCYRTFDIPHGRQIKLCRSWPDWETGSYMVHYEVTEGRRIITPPRLLGFCESGQEPPDYELMTACGGTMAALLQKGCRNFVEIVHDTTTDESWPGEDTGSSGAASDRVRLKQLIKKLQPDAPVPLLVPFDP